MDFQSLGNRIRGFGPRLRRISAFAKCGAGPLDKAKMAIAGYARGHTFDSRGLISLVGRKLFPSLEVRPIAFGGLRLRVEPSNLSDLVVAEEILVDHVYALSEMRFQPDTIVDCGAHIGMFTLLAAAHFPQAKLICFEPDPDNCRRLRQHLSRNHLEAQILNAAVSDRDGYAPFAAMRGCGSSLVTGPAIQEKTLEVETIDLSGFLKCLQSTRLLIKMDIEGAEEWVLPGILPTLPAWCGVLIETHNGEEAWTKVKRLFENAGFTAQSRRRRGRYIDGAAFRPGVESGCIFDAAKS